MDRRLAWTAMAALLVFAGCAGSGGPSGELAVTPAPLPTDPTPTPVFRLAPGISVAGVVAPLAVSSAHAEVLRSSSFLVSIEEWVEPVGGGPIEYRVVAGTVANRTSYRLIVRRDVGNETRFERHLYADTDALYERLVVDTGPRYYVPRERLAEEATYPSVALGHLDQRELLSIALIATEPAYSGTSSVNGTTFHRVVSSEASEPVVLAGWNYADTVTDVEFEALVAADGHVREFRLTYVERVGDDRRRVHRVARWTAIGNATVSAPEWYEAAQERADH